MEGDLTASDKQEMGWIVGIFYDQDRIKESIAGLAVAATLAPATHARFIHGQPLKTLAPRVIVAVPLAYLVMRAVHAVIAS